MYVPGEQQTLRWYTFRTFLNKKSKAGISNLATKGEALWEDQEEGDKPGGGVGA